MYHSLNCVEDAVEKAFAISAVFEMAGAGKLNRVCRQTA